MTFRQTLIFATILLGTHVSMFALVHFTGVSYDDRNLLLQICWWLVAFWILPILALIFVSLSFVLTKLKQDKEN